MMAAIAEENESKTKNESVSCYKTIIIGAGIAGISAAHHLVKNGETDFKILEARNRIGGRIISIPVGKEQVDLGASWIHGVLGNPIYELALSNGLISLTNDQDPHTVVATTEDGKRVPISVVEEVYSAYFWFSKRCEEYFLLHLQTPPHIDSVGKHLEMDIAAYLQQYHGDEAVMRRKVFDHLLSRETCITGCHSMDETSLSDFGSYSELPGGNVSIPGGFHLIINFLADILPKDSIRLQCEVKHIKWKMKTQIQEHEASKESDSNIGGVSPNQISIECGDGSKWLTQHVIVTLPLGVLKIKAEELFEPKLPDYKMECIENLSFGAVNKIYLEYDRPFLNAEISEVITLWARMEEEDISKTWFRKIYSFRRYTENILLAWVSGREAEYLETLPEEQVANTCTDILRKFLNDPYIPRPCKVICTSWKSHPYSRGSYSYIGVKGSQRDIELLATPIYADPYHSKPALMFAGEATHPSFYSTTHGAYLSGKKCAELLLEPDSDPNNKHDRKEHCGDKDLSSWIRGIDLT
ncbi:spermine oxidase [Nephila pilipes]|uniref:Spermine oxidase n=1 Tax=Nephila pilipes TaxID=299642 RepID=A0A8X6T8T2_NEPPI|nr:spermine oxidase [Nephila pilipes]